jgi:hypothetical protein
MREWWTYRPEDFLLFSERVYWRLFELHNAAVWPAQAVAIGLGAAVLIAILARRRWSGRLAALVFAAAWLFVALGFLWLRFKPINWAIGYVVPLFVLEALLFLWIGGVRNRLAFETRFRTSAGIGPLLFVYALVVHPITALLAGRSIAGAEVFAIAPDPLAIGTLGLLTMARGGAATGLLLVVPLAWCALSGATLLTMGAFEGWIPLAAIALTLVAMLSNRSK